MHMFRKTHHLVALITAVGLFLVLPAQAAIQEKAVTYQHDDTVLTGYLYWDDSSTARRPGILVIHEWWGLNAYAKRRAKMLAELGYVAFAADMYGNHQVTDKPEQAGAWMQEITADIAYWRERANLGLAQLRQHPLVAPGELAAIGYCFGGGTVLQMAYGGTDLKAVVGFHASLPAAPAEAKDKIKARILVLHGAEDTFVSPAVVENFQKKLSAAHANWEMDIYGGAHHSFTNPDAGQFGIPNLQYNQQADGRSWTRMQALFQEVFKK